MPHFASIVPVLRDSATGAVRWLGQPLAREGTIHLAGPFVGFKQGLKMVVRHRTDGSHLAELAAATRMLSVAGRIFVEDFLADAQVFADGHSGYDWRLEKRIY